MIKNALLALIAAGALSVPLAGAAWAEPSADPGSPHNEVGKGGIPQKLGDFVASGVTPAAGTGDPVPPGQEFNLAKDLFPGEPTPDAIRDFESALWSTHTLADGTVIPSDPELWEDITPGLAIKPLTPGCDRGGRPYPARRSASADNGDSAPPAFCSPGAGGMPCRGQRPLSDNAGRVATPPSR